MVGPTFNHESRITEKDITADDSHKDEIVAENELKKDDKESETETESKTESNTTSMQKAGFDSNIQPFQLNQRFSGHQNYQHPFPIGPAHFPGAQRYAQGLHAHPPQPNQHPHSPDSILPGQYPFIPPVAPFRFNWDSAPIESTQQYEPIPAFNNPAPIVYPFVPQMNPYQLYQQFRRQY